MIGRLAAYLSGFTLRFWLIALGIVLAFAAMQTLRLSWAQAENARMERDKAREIAAAVAQARKADARAHQAMNRAKAASGAQIERGRNAAEGSPDPWRSATEAMR